MKTLVDVRADIELVRTALEFTPAELRGDVQCALNRLGVLARDSRLAEMVEE